MNPGKQYDNASCITKDKKVMEKQDRNIIHFSLYLS